MKNSILAALPAHDLQLMTAALTPVDLERDTVLYEVGQPLSHVYFPVGSLVSYLSSTAKGQTVEVCTVGNEGMVGAASLGSGIAVFRAVVQISGGRLPDEHRSAPEGGTTVRRPERSAFAVHQCVAVPRRTDGHVQ